MELGAFSVSLAVKDLQDSKAFYEKLGFTVFHGDESQNWLIMSHGDHKVGLFHGMFESNILTFNPGWNQNAEATEDFTDIREILCCLSILIPAWVECQNIGFEHAMKESDFVIAM